jgi:hypothetical protein
MRGHSVTLVIAVFAGFLGGSLSTRLFNVSPAYAAGKSATFDSVTTSHLVVSGDIVVQSTAIRPIVLKDGNGNSLEFIYVSGAGAGFYLAIKNPTTAKTDIPAAILSENGLAIVRTDGKGITNGVQLSPDQLAITYKDQSKVPWSAFSNTLDFSSATVSFDDGKPVDLVHSSVSIDGFSYNGHGKEVRLPQ